MEDHYLAALHPSNAWYPFNSKSKSNDLYRLSAEVISNVVAYARQNQLSELELNNTLDYARDTFDGLVKSFKPFTEVQDDPNTFWRHQFTSEGILSDAKFRPSPTFNNYFDGYVTDYIATPYLHTPALTNLLIDAYLYEDMANTVVTFRKAYDTLKALNPSHELFLHNSKHPWLRLVWLFFKGVAPYAVGFLVYLYDVTLLTPYMLFVLYCIYSGHKQKSKISEAYNEIYKNTIKTYRRYSYYPLGHNANALYIDIFQNCPDVYFPKNLYDLIEVLKAHPYKLENIKN
ncbi:hypothetical protein ACO1PK_02445 [Alishewanella sp. d11]|uniref:hypothetical protein n=1 Tax=Alishewanella sp. d11 TaxID=3414030 RepID=UPI003BF8A162